MTDYIACLKHGSYYSADYVNRLRNMVLRNLKRPVKFLCFTEDSKGLHKDIEVLPLPDLGISGPKKAWWYKLKIFDKSLPYSGTVLFLDLDIVIIKSIDQFFDFKPGKFCIIDDYAYEESDNVCRNSSVFRMEFKSYPMVWDLFIKYQDKITARLEGDQNWITEQITDDIVWPKDWTISYRWEYANQKPEAGKVIPLETYDASLKRSVPHDCSIIIFHGHPKPHEVVGLDNPDPFIVKHWQ